MAATINLDVSDLVTKYCPSVVKKEKTIIVISEMTLLQIVKSVGAMKSDDLIRLNEALFTRIDNMSVPKVWHYDMVLFAVVDRIVSGRPLVMAKCVIV